MQQQNETRLIDLPAPANVARLRILLADDSRVIQAQLAHVLKGLGHDVTIVTTGLAAFEITGKQQFDIVFMDLEMPVMDGLQATLAIRERERVDGSRTRIIAMSAHASESFEQHCLDVGMDGYVTKPVETNRVRALFSLVTPAR